MSETLPQCPALQLLHATEQDTPAGTVARYGRVVGGMLHALSCIAGLAGWLAEREPHGIRRAMLLRIYRTAQVAANRTERVCEATWGEEEEASERPPAVPADFPCSWCATGILQTAIEDHGSRGRLDVLLCDNPQCGRRRVL